MKKNLLTLLAFTWLSACISCVSEEVPAPERPQIPKPVADTLRYLALGDSYTIGTSVDPKDRFPVQLAGRLGVEGLPVAAPLIVARVGWSTGDLLAALEREPPKGKFDFVTLLIGVNNQYRQLSVSSYEQQFTQLLDTAITYAGRKERVFVLSIPDYAYTPFGRSFFDPGRISREIDQFNAVNKRITEGAGVTYFDITPISRRGLDDPLLVASDGLHPSGEMYRRWVELALPEVLRRLKN